MEGLEDLTHEIHRETPCLNELQHSPLRFICSLHTSVMQHCHLQGSLTFLIPTNLGSSFMSPTNVAVSAH